MAKHYAVTPKLKAGRRVYTATFRDASGEQVTRSLRTGDENDAKMICLGLVICRNVRLVRREDAPPTVPDASIDLYLGVNPESGEGGRVAAEDVAAAGRALKDRIERTEPELRAVVLPEQIRGALTELELRRTRTRLYGAQGELRSEASQRSALEQSVLGRIAKAQGEMPCLADCVPLYKRYMQANVSDGTVKANVSFATKFAASLPKDKLPVLVSGADIEAFLTARALEVEQGGRKRRRRNDRIRLSSFVNWCAKTWQFRSPMEDVPAVGMGELLNERGDIVWHEIDEIEAVLKPLDVYWQAIVASLAYAGLQLAELCWLRLGDVDLEKGKFWVTTVSDPEVAGVVHPLKTFRRRREVNMDPVYLLPRLRAFAAANLHGQSYFFKRITLRRAKRVKNPGSIERWLAINLSHKLCEGMLPKGMTPRTLRHTAGSLAIRYGGMSILQVAAFLGNSPETCFLHYARLLGGEVKVNFTKPAAQTPPPAPPEARPPGPGQAS